MVELGIREAKSNLSKLVEAVRGGDEVFLTNRGERVAQIVAAAKPKTANRGRGMWKGKVNLYPGWDSPAADKEIENLFDTGD